MIKTSKKINDFNSTDNCNNKIITLSKNDTNKQYKNIFSFPTFEETTESKKKKVNINSTNKITNKNIL